MSARPFKKHISYFDSLYWTEILNKAQVQGILHVGLGMGLRDSNSSQRIFIFVKNWVTYLSPCLIECTSCSKYEIQK